MQPFKKIEEYHKKNQALNEVVQAPAVKENLQKGVKNLRDLVSATFDGGKEEVAAKQKRNSKALQFEAYKDQRK